MLVEKCQSCGSPLHSLVDLGAQVPVNNFEAEYNPKAKKFPLELLHCHNCDLAQLSYQVPREELFPSSYPYRTASSSQLRENFCHLAADIRQLGAKSVCEIGSNDGTLLENLKDLRHLGIDPSDACEDARAKGLRVIQEYFDFHLTRELDEKFDVVTTSNCFAHMPDVDDLMRGVAHMLNTHGVFIVEAHYFPGLVRTLQWDTIYHEHLRYYSLKSLSFLLEKHGFEVFFAMPIESHGGSIRVFASRKGQRAISPCVNKILSEEAKLDLSDFAVRVNRSIQILQRCLGHLSDAYIIKAIGAPSRGATLMQFLRGMSMYDVYELPSSPKVGKTMPGTSFSVVVEPTDFGDTDYLLLLNWHIADEMISKLKAKGYQGHFIIPLPELRIL